jgi:hypothetical protein
MSLIATMVNSLLWCLMLWDTLFLWCLMVWQYLASVSTHTENWALAPYVLFLEELRKVSWLLCSCCLKKIKNHIYLFEKKIKHKSGHSKWRNLKACKILIRDSLYCRLQKNLLKFGGLKYAYPDPHVCYFCEYFVFEIEILHVYGTIHWLQHDFFLIFLKHIHVIFFK